ncbi:MAG: hypothetical protein AB7K24_26870 [Gemmataceae bacterium]
MQHAAKVTSLEAVQEFRSALLGFGADTREALSANDMEIQRAAAWLDEQLRFWKKEIHVRDEKLQTAKRNLQRKKMSKVMGRHPDCSEEEDIFELAKKRFQEAEQKLANCKRWIPQLQRAVEEYQGKARILGGMLEADLPRVSATLERKLDALDDYVRMAPPPTPSAETGDQSKET